MYLALLQAAPVLVAEGQEVSMEASDRFRENRQALDKGREEAHHFLPIPVECMHTRLQQTPTLMEIHS
jgi:hypothetical protein